MNFIFAVSMWVSEKNININSKRKGVGSYARQIYFLSIQVKKLYKSKLYVFTNDADSLIKFFPNGYDGVIFLKYKNKINIPDDIGFYGAHYKIEAIRSALDILNHTNDKLVLLDPDIIFREAFNEEQEKFLSSSGLFFYDISNQIFPSYGEFRVKNDIIHVSGRQFNKVFWCGGELLIGDYFSLSKLVDYVDFCLKKYFASYKGLHHNGDEMYFSVALNCMSSDGYSITSVNNYNIISRHWSRFSDKPFKEHFSKNIIHCPGSKPAIEFLSYFHSFISVYHTMFFYHKFVYYYHKIKYQD